MVVDKMALGEIAFRHNDHIPFKMDHVRGIYFELSLMHNRYIVKTRTPV